MPSDTSHQHRFGKEMRIRRQADFSRVYARRQRASDHLLLVYGCENGLPHPRLGLSVSRKVGGAVVRNRWKRLLREAFRLTQHELPRGIDLVVIPARDKEPVLEQLKRSLPKLARRVAARLESKRR